MNTTIVITSANSIKLQSLQLIFAALLANKTKKKLAVIEIILNDASFTVIKN